MADVKNEIIKSESMKTQLWFHVKLLYGVIMFMIIGYISSMTLVYIQLNRLLDDNTLYFKELAYYRDSCDGTLNLTEYGKRLKVDLRKRELAEKNEFGEEPSYRSQWKRSLDKNAKSKPYYRLQQTEAVNSQKEEWVWMSSFSRIPTTTLQYFCAATKDYCPKGFPGPPGMKGQKGDVGDSGKDGLPGDIGPQGPTGPEGEKGSQGSDGIQGPLGPPGLTGEKGEIGDPGFNGTDGPMGRRGIPGPSGEPGLAGMKGDKGDRGEPLVVDEFLSNCSCPAGVKGSKGEPGYVNTADVDTDSLVGWIEPPQEIITTTQPPEETVPPEPTIPPRKDSCKIRLVNKPEFKRHTGSYWGSWFKDTGSQKENDEKVWLTKHHTGVLLYEYSTFEEFRKDKVHTSYELKDPFHGTGHVVYQGSFIYHKSGSNEIIKYSLKEERVVATLSLFGAAYNGGSSLFSVEHNYLDFSVDENGLWAIYAIESDLDLLLVAKLNDSFAVEKEWNISVSRRNYGNGFIACGVLYLVRDTRAKTTVIDFAYDLYTGQNLNVRLKFTNPFQMNNMIAYNSDEKKLFSWDKGHQLIYPLTMTSAVNFVY